MVYGVSNGHVTDDVMWPPKVLWDSTVSILAIAWLLVFLATSRCLRAGGSWKMWPGWPTEWENMRTRDWWATMTFVCVPEEPSQSPPDQYFLLLASAWRHAKLFFVCVCVCVCVQFCFIAHRRLTCLCVCVWWVDSCCVVLSTMRRHGRLGRRYSGNSHSLGSAERSRQRCIHQDDTLSVTGGKHQRVIIATPTDTIGAVYAVNPLTEAGSLSNDNLY